MRIIGGHDYYDGVVPFDTDRSRVFLRDAREVELPLTKHNFRVQTFPKGWGSELYALELIFCGKRYLGLELALSRSVPGQFTTERQNHFIWTFERYKDLQRTLGFTFETVNKRNRRWDDTSLYENDLEDFFIPKEATDLSRWLLDERVLVAIAPPQRNRWGNTKVPWVINGDGLKDVHFASAVEPWRAYQELDMFLGTILVGDEDRMVKVSDKTKLAKYGFDNWSFKNAVHAGKPRGSR